MIPAVIAAGASVLVDAVARGADRVLASHFPDPAQRQTVVVELLGDFQAADLKQMEVNAAEAASGSAYAAGWRPTIGYVCAAALAYQYLLAPLGLWGASWASVIAGHDWLATMPPPPRIDDHLWELMFGLLGLGALRSFEKVRGVAR
jgi:hypothetical protein